MTISTYASIITALTGLTVTGVTRKFTYPPASIGTADLPAMWPMNVRGEERPMTFAGGGGWGSFSCDLWIAIVPVDQGTPSQNYTSTQTILDSLNTALRGLSTGRSKLSWTTTANTSIAVAGTAYWAVLATISGNL